MKRKQTFLLSGMRALLASATVCLLILQSFAFTCCPSPMREGVATVSAKASIQAPECHRSGDPTAPKHSSHDCCVYCSVAGRDALAQAIAFVAGFIIAPTPSVVAAVYYQVDIRNPAPLGLTTSWSSRAPPQIG